MDTFLTSCPIEEPDQFRENIKVRPPRSKRPQSHRIGNLSKKTQIKAERELQIFKENQILLKKMIKIDSKPPSLSHFRTLSAPNRGRSISRTQNQFKIDLENKRIIKRLKSTTSHYSIVKLEQENKYREYLKNKISKKAKPAPKVRKENFDKVLIERILKRRVERLEKV